MIKQQKTQKKEEELRWFFIYVVERGCIFRQGIGFFDPWHAFNGIYESSTRFGSFLVKASSFHPLLGHHCCRSFSLLLSFPSSPFVFRKFTRNRHNGRYLSRFLITSNNLCFLFESPLPNTYVNRHHPLVPSTICYAFIVRMPMYTCQMGVCIY